MMANVAWSSFWSAQDAKELLSAALAGIRTAGFAIVRRDITPAMAAATIPSICRGLPGTPFCDGPNCECWEEFGVPIATATLEAFIKAGEVKP